MGVPVPDVCPFICGETESGVQVNEVPGEDEAREMMICCPEQVDGFAGENETVGIGFT
jgi:hypothetical protein